ncbi:hypothetical protein DPEC_G00295420 [Dallia pectoralis]|uniref:Uncharacterized protein n=1 Tax=Dallia pectoralis TaxID=75939 RepID=A0ACC2FIS9_DALPE|nr:hypothetical protein DPEC_G00295420 [Dallia pectoralis]
MMSICNQDTAPEETQTRGVKAGILMVVEDDVSVLSSPPTVKNIRCLTRDSRPASYLCLFGLLFALEIEYPKELKYTFETIEKVFRDLGSQCSARVKSFKTKLFL